MNTVLYGCCNIQHGSIVQELCVEKKKKKKT
jgi:hypothetical protein